MDTPRSPTPVAEPGASESLFDSTRLILSPQLSPSGASSSAVRGHASTGGVQRSLISFRERAATLLQPSKKLAPPPTAWQSIRAILLASYLNVLLVCIPISWAVNFALPEEHTLIFVFSFLAILPLAKLLGFATDELSLRVGQTLAGLTNATLRNVVGLIISIIALTKCKIDIVQASLVGSILSNLLLVLGMCFFVGGLKFSEQGFTLIVVQLNSSLLTISAIAVLLPGALFVLDSSSDRTSVDQEILNISHGVAIILLFVYICSLIFQFISHKALYHHSDDIVGSRKYRENPFELKKFRRGKQVTVPEYTDMGLFSSPLSSPHPQVHFLEPGSWNDNRELGDITGPEEETVEPQMNVPVSIGLLVVVTVVVAVTAEFLVDSINGLADTGGISKAFIGVILLPIVGNAAELPERASEVTVTFKDKLTVILGVAVGSSVQILLFVIPVIVTLGWILDKPLTLLFDPLQTIVLFLSVLSVNHVVQAGRSNWLDGMILICFYLILCVTFWYYPGMLQPWANLLCFGAH